jgi:triacylglycerol lipase
MLARAFRRILLIELLIYLAAGCGLVRLAGWNWADAGLAIFAFALGLRALGIAMTFVIAARHASPVPPEHRLNFVGRLKLYFVELGAYILIYNLYQPFESLFVGTEKPQPSPQRPLPVLLLHGYVCNRGFMLPLRRYLRAHGIAAYSHNLEPVYAGIDSYAGGLARQVEKILADTGAEKLVILAHSMGGLVARAYIRQCGAHRVAKLITLGTPHHGTVMARLGAGENGRQMVPDSAWLQRLNEDAPTLPLVSVFSHQDNIVLPQESAALAGAKVVRLSGIGHVSMPFSRRIREVALAEILAAGG